VEGSEQYISECEPYDANVKIYEEVCTLNKYTHDNTADQSYLNKTYFYFENGNRINIEECVKSATNFSHKFDTALCEVEYDDKNKETTIFARRYIEDTTLGGKVFVDDCEQLNEKVTYLKSDGVWQKSGVITVPFKSPKSEQYGYSVRPYDSWRTFGFLRRYGSPEEIFHKGLVGWQERGRRPIGAPRIFSECKVSLSELKSGFRWMRSVPILQPDQIKLSSQVAKFREDFSNKSSIKADAVREESRVCRVETSTPSGAVNFLLFRIRVSYKNIACEGTLMKKAAIYKRYDGSEYIDNTEVLDTALVCGDGSKLDGKRI